MQTAQDSDKPYFVVAEDDPDHHYRIKDAIKKYDLNFIVTSVFNGVQLLDLLMRRGFYQTSTFRAPDAIILDLQMYVMDGLDALKEIKSHPELQRIPVYSFTSPDRASQGKQALELGAVKVFQMPKLPSELEQIVVKVCQEVAAQKKRQST